MLSPVKSPKSISEHLNWSTRYQAEPGNADPEALPPISIKACDAEPLDIGFQAEPGS
jgi:hypothetical protein